MVLIVVLVVLVAVALATLQLGRDGAEDGRQGQGRGQGKGQKQRGNEQKQDRNPGPARARGAVLWDGGFERGGVPPGANGPSCGTGEDDGDSDSDEYVSVEEEGNTSCDVDVALVEEPTRTPDSRRALQVTLGPGQQRAQMQSEHTWAPDDRGSVEEWYGFSLYYGEDWQLGYGVQGEVSAESWHNPVAFRTSDGNGSLNLSGDMDLDNANGLAFETFTEPHLVLRRNTVLNEEGFYDDGLGLDKLDLGPIVTGQWIDVVCHVQWSTTATGALRECWRDGEYRGERRSLNAVNSAPHSLRVGAYQTTAITHPRTTYVDNVRIGRSYLAVDPAR